MRNIPDLLRQSPRTLHHVLRAQDFADGNCIMELFSVADWLEHNEYRCMEHKNLVWYAGPTDASTRTRLSTTFAARRLGANVDAVNSSDSSQEKGESIEDTIKSIATMGANVIVMRHSDEDAIWRAARVCPVPLINGGSGAVHHPTQALLDLYTIFRQRKTLEGLRIALIGDLKYGRTTNSLAYLLSKFNGVQLFLVSPEHLRMKGELVYYLEQKGMRPRETTILESVLDKVDVIYQTRKQKERSSNTEEHAGLSDYTLTPQLVRTLPTESIIMHPLPRNEELPRELDDLPQAKYFDQMYCGELIRRALLAKIFTPPDR